MYASFFTFCCVLLIAKDASATPTVVTQCHQCPPDVKACTTETCSVDDVINANCYTATNANGGMKHGCAHADTCTDPAAGDQYDALTAEGYTTIECCATAADDCNARAESYTPPKVEAESTGTTTNTTKSTGSGAIGMKSSLLFITPALAFIYNYLF